jgi:hypothetical protein
MAIHIHIGGSGKVTTRTSDDAKLDQLREEVSKTLRAANAAVESGVGKEKAFADYDKALNARVKYQLELGKAGK